MLLGLLPFLAFILGCTTLADPLGCGSWRRGVLRVAVLWGFYAVLTLEILSLFYLVRQSVLILVWLIPIAVLIGVKVSQIRRTGWSGWRFDWLPAGALDKLLAVSVLAVMLFTALVAWLAPPSTWDSLNYHMPRVSHWSQQGAVRHFTTGVEIQNTMPPAAEMMVLHTFALARGDHWVHFINWSAVWISVLGVSWLASQLGASVQGQWMTAAFAASLPMAIIQASNTMTDALVGLWLVAVAVETLNLMKRRELTLPGACFMAAAAGLAALTKPTAFAYLLPFALLVAVLLVRFTGWRRLILLSSLAVIIVLGINAGHWSRNYQDYGNPISQPVRIEKHRSPWLGGRAFLSNLVRNVAMHAATPSPHVNKGITLLVQEFHQFIDLEVNDSRTTATGRFKIRWGETNEDKATNPLHAYIILAVLVAALVNREGWTTDRLIYFLVSAATLVAFSLLFKWQLYAGRYHFPFFLLMAPLLGSLADRWVRPGWWQIFSISLIVLSWPWLFQIKSRPIIPNHSESYVGSVLTTSRSQLYLANAAYFEDMLDRFSMVIKDSQCQQVGLVLGGGAPEYLWWVWLNKPGSPVRLSWIVDDIPASKSSEEAAGFCAVICRECGTQQHSFRDLPLVERRSRYSLFLNGGG